MTALAAALAAFALAVAPASAARHDAPVPILMYHVVAAPPSGAPFPGLYVTRRDFAGQVAWLAAHGYTGVTLDEVFAFWRGKGRLPRRPVVLSFDDGYHSQYANARPILRARGWPGVLNLEFRNLQPSWGIHAKQVRALVAAGWEIDAHTLTHPDLTTVGAAQLRREVAGSRRAIRRAFHVPVDFFCYPSGRYDSAVLAEVRRAGYLGATTTEYGLARFGSRWTLPRVRVDGSDGVTGLAHKLTALEG